MKVNSEGPERPGLRKCDGREIIFARNKVILAREIPSRGSCGLLVTLVSTSYSFLNLAKGLR